MFLDPRTLAPLDLANAVYSEFIGDPSFGDCVQREFLSSQLEFVSPIYRTLSRAAADVTAFRRRLGETAAAFDAVVGSTGVPFLASRPPHISRSERYADISETFGAIVADHQVNALHVHVEVPSRDEGVAVLAHIRRWLPVLLALSANSPYWNEADTGFASWRTIVMRRWSTAGCPPEFVDADDYDRRVAAIVGVGGTVDVGTVAWNARLSERYPTVEFRVADAQLDADATVLLVALCRALVQTALDEGAARRAPGPAPELLDSALWHAARHGLAATLVHPFSGELEPASTVVRALRAHVDSALRTSGDDGAVDELLERMLAGGSGAFRQRRAFARAGTTGISELFASAVARTAPAGEAPGARWLDGSPRGLAKAGGPAETIGSAPRPFAVRHESRGTIYGTPVRRSSDGA